MRHDNRVDQGWGRWLAVVLVGSAMLVGAMPIGAQPVSGGQRHDLEDGDWVKQPVHAPGSPADKLNAIRRLIAEGKGKEAKHAADEWIEANAGHALLAEAYLTRGDANVARKHFFKSLFDYEYVIREFPGSEQFHTAMEREFELAKLFAAGLNRRLWGVRVLPANDEAEEIFVRIQERSPGSELGEMASLMLADYYFDKPQMDSAAEAYDLFLINYPRSQKREWAMLRLIQANLARFKGPRFDATGLIDAGQRLKSFRVAYPASAERIGVDALLIRIDESLAMRDMVAAGWHVKRKQDLSAIYLYQRVVTDYPRTAAAQDALRVLDKMGAPVLSTESVESNERPLKPARQTPVTEPTVQEVKDVVEEGLEQIESSEDADVLELKEAPPARSKTPVEPEDDAMDPLGPQPEKP